ncbi:hypothetical protein A5731_21660 [Mycolicibacterium conceptionense]|uniref:Uncharacterized protein n=1 Tax=Mycolicibacterium conceptionense TaxID=451644 RepID=A0A1A0PBZ9_9MYCO|nr:MULTISPECIES: hypothetical protein [Mycolicibacterium]MCW1823915.1 hypothetical protein [Mycolicibacterium senegalense]OBB06794.1 hypothetical protein A5718_00920 [Mycolicibacterium conceptionense]OBE98799.1 hypothetical protein A5731_21660 [Mycolicibacterium conceptionense]OBF16178.1 hypothetical protein A5726_21845 [Mycolicibacterium conceptionense]OBF47906.1 hypothetical protein A5720_02280 [Mycolicibacterium conceptionense]
MAVRPLVTTGVALLSAGALVAGTPALFVPRDVTAIVAGEATAAAPQKRAVTINELKLLGLADLDPQFMSDIFFRTDGYGGHVGGSYDPYYGGDNYGLFELNVQTGGTAENPVYSPALDAKGNRLYAYLDEDGNPLVGDTAIYVKDANGNLTQVSGDAENPPTYASGDGISGEIYRDGLVGLAYYLGDLALEDVMGANVPLISDAAAFVYNNVTSYFYEGGIEETFRVVASELTGGPSGLGAQVLAAAEDLSHNWLAYTGTVAILAASGVPLAGPDLAAATSIFFFGGPVVEDGKSYNQGIDGVINYVVDRVLGAQAPDFETDPEDTGEGEEGADAASTKRSVAALASASSALPSLKNLINLNVKADEVEPVEAAVEQTPEAQKTDGIAELAAEKLGLKLANADTVKEVATQEESEVSEGATGATESAGSTDTAGADDASGAGAPAAGATGGTSSTSTHEPSSTQVKKSPVDKFVDNATRDLKKAFGGSSNRNANRHSGSTGGSSTTGTSSDASGTDSASSGSSSSSSSSSSGGSSSSGSSSSSTGGSSSSSGSGSGDTGNGHKDKKDNKTKKADKHKSDK